MSLARSAQRRARLEKSHDARVRQNIGLVARENKRAEELKAWAEKRAAEKSAPTQTAAPASGNPRLARMQLMQLLGLGLMHRPRWR